LRIASQEVRRALGVPKVVIQLGVPDGFNPPDQQKTQEDNLPGSPPQVTPTGEVTGNSNQGGSHE